MAGSKAGKWGKDLSAIVDVGSNTVRLVVYGGTRRAPSVFLNEKVTARLGRELTETGLIPEKASEMALAGLRRYALLLSDLEVKDVQVAATAAAREASNGQAFLDEVQALGFEPRLLSGKDEAEASAMGVIGAFPGARGIVADIGGGSLELAWVEDGKVTDCASLPLGTLRLPALSAGGPKAFKEAIREALDGAGWTGNTGAPLYLVGGTWRALATYVLHRQRSPLTDPHGIALPYDDALGLAKALAKVDVEKFANVPGLASSRAETLPDAAQLLRIILEELSPSQVVISAWGLREGLLYQRLDGAARSQDPLLAAVAEFTEPFGGTPSRAAMIAAWSVNALEPGGTGSERERLAVTMLTLALARVEPNLRIRTAMEWALDKRWIGLDTQGRAMAAAALLGSSGQTFMPDQLAQLAEPDALFEAMVWGLAARLCRRLGAGSRVSLMSSYLSRDDNAVTLQIEESRAQLIGENARKDLALLADFLGLESKVKVVEEIQRRS
ncbi:Ppx/GppA family phosphatase [Altererythrobacter sp. ZODW24]|uniref:Ppx/GppA family phosphatase n=1 Tax=Altererythrobacter sp. ZODW24 TaxID=2185142 RepID=UPI000DF81B30|nr:Ppx/GppA family phosphatase [Altererythrobacter sp. ZODW24]